MSSKLEYKHTFINLGICLVLLFILVAIFKNDNVATNIKLQLSVKTTIDDVFQVYYDDGSDFKEENSVKLDVKGSNHFQTLVFKMPGKPFKRLRLDFGTTSTEIYIKQINIKNFKKIDIINEFTNVNLISDIHMVDRTLFIKSAGGNDPFIHTGDISITADKILHDKTKNQFINALIIIFCIIIFTSLQLTKVTLASSRPLHLIWKSAIVLFMFIILLPQMSVFFGFNPKTASTENRNLSKAPTLSFEADKLTKYPSQFEEYFNDNFGYRNLLVQWNNLIRVKMFNISSNKDVLIGKKDWLYLNGESIDDFRGLLRYTEQELLTIKTNLIKRKEWFDKNGIAFFIVIAPNKNTIYPEYLPNSIKASGKDTKLEQLLVYLKKNSNIQIINLREPLLDAKSKELLYIRTDTHWNEYGAFVGYQEIMKQITKLYPSIQSSKLDKYSVIRKRVPGGDLAAMLAMDSSYMEDRIFLEPKFNFLSEKADIKRWPMYTLESQLSAREVKSNTALPRLLMFRDSFTDALIPLLSEHFSRSAFVSAHHFDLDIIQDEKPNVVIYEYVERNVPEMLNVDNNIK